MKSLSLILFNILLNYFRFQLRWVYSCGRPCSYVGRVVHGVWMGTWNVCVRPLLSGHQHNWSYVPFVAFLVGLLVAFLDLVVGSSSAHFFLSLGAYHRYLSCLDSMLFFAVHFQMLSSRTVCFHTSVISMLMQHTKDLTGLSIGPGFFFGRSPDYIITRNSVEM